MTLIQAVILAVIEGLTEFLPVSSTGHIIIGSSAMGIAHEEFTKVFTVAVQFGAILAVVALYWRRFIQSFPFYLKLFVAFLPAAVLGKILNSRIDLLLENVLVVAVSLLVGGVVFLFIDRWFPGAEGQEDPSYASAFKIGLFQVIAMIPGVSRSAATIIGGLQQKLTRKGAAEFSFFLAVPTIFAAAVYKIFAFYQAGYRLDEGQWNLLLAGNLAAFAVAVLAIKSFIALLNRHGFRLFGYYRIVVGLVLITFWLFRLSV
jgi:undecaprenyl-diphosphatase